MSLFPIRLGRTAFIVMALNAVVAASPAQAPSARVDEALQNITAIVRTGQVGYATIWDGNKYVQCRRQPDNAMRREAAGASMQPSLRNVLNGERLGRIAALGWVLDASFGNYVQSFPQHTPTARIAEQIMRVLSEGYDAKVSALEIDTKWIANVPCPPRNGPTQNLAGIVNDARSMRSTAVKTCSYQADVDTPQKVSSADELIAIYGATVTAEIQRLRINSTRKVFAIFDAGIGYVQCMPERPDPALYCEAQSAESWPALAAILTPDRVSQLYKVGYADPGYAPNYSKSYPFDKHTDTAIANEILTILHNVYGYTGAAKLNISTK